MTSLLVFLVAAVIAVPLFKKLKLGAILGYLIAGTVIGPAALNLVSDPVTIMHVAELGVVFLLFLIGIELEPDKLWRMRGAVLVTGGGQLLLTTGVIFAVLFAFMGYSAALVVALALALSSTAFAIQLMREQRILNNPPGQQGLGVLLMQDVAVVPILILVAALASSGAASDGPAWYWGVGAVLLLLLAGRYFINPFLRIMSGYGSPEVMTASALLIVLATSLGLAAAGLSMGMGAFIAGVLLANSSFRHQLETEIEPFKGLLLGLFFISIGMTLDLGLLVSEPLLIVGAAIVLVLVKTLIIWSLLKLAGQTSRDAIRVGLMLSQGGEFAFVVMAQAAAGGLLEATLVGQVNLIVGVSMALTAPLVILHGQFFSSSNCPPVYDSGSQVTEPQVLIAGFGRFGQITGRILAANKIAFTALDNNAEHIEFVKRFGNKVFYGDASRLDLLRSAGIEEANTLLIALDNEEQGLQLAELVEHHFPHVRVIARAHNRFSIRQYRERGAEQAIRELAGSSLLAADQVLQQLGFTAVEAAKMVQMFDQHDREMLEESLLRDDVEADAIAHHLYDRERLASLFAEDRESIRGTD